jgi:TctA family transporter
MYRLLHGLMKELHRLVFGTTTEHTNLRRRLATTFLATFVVDLIGTGLMYFFEHGKQGSDIHSLFQGFFWVTTQLLTVSSQMANPVTTGGRIVDIFLELWAITVVAASAGSFAAFLQEKQPAVTSSSPSRSQA